jgi:nicotinamide-nucleotide amidase
MPGVVLGYRASFPEIEVKVFARADNEPEAERKARQVADEVRARLGDAVYGERDDAFADVVGRALRHRGLTLALAESCTGGLLGSMLTSVPGSSDYLLVDALTYANSAKTKLLGVSPETLRAHGAVSEETAASMAEGALRLAGSDLALSITGIAGPGGGTEHKPVGTVWFGLARKNAPTQTKMRRLPGDRSRIRTLAAYVGLRTIWRATQGQRTESD